jgi:hypothetical protein
VKIEVLIINLSEIIKIQLKFFKKI